MEEWLVDMGQQRTHSITSYERVNRISPPGRGPLAVLMIYSTLRQELENSSGECCRITTGPIMADILKNVGDGDGIAGPRTGRRTWDAVGTACQEL